MHKEDLPEADSPAPFFRAVATTIMIDFDMRDPLGHAGDRHAHQVLSAAGGRANIQRPRHEACDGCAMHAEERVRNSIPEHFPPRCLVPLQKVWTRVSGKHTIIWQCLWESVHRPRRREVAKQDLHQEANGRISILLRRLEGAKLIHNSVLHEELVLVSLAAATGINLAVRERPLSRCYL